VTEPNSPLDRIEPTTFKTVEFDESGPRNGFEIERAAWLGSRSALLESAEGKFVVFVGREMQGPFETIRDAQLAGFRRSGGRPIYIKQVVVAEPRVEAGTNQTCR
jgi:hypothetical protein